MDSDTSESNLVILTNKAYLSFYIFLVTASFFAGDFLHPGVTSFLPIVFFTIMGTFNKKLINTIIISNSVLDCVAVMAMILAVEHSNIHKRAAIKILLIFGCSHFRLSFILFMSTAVLSMWFSNCMACGLMMPLVKAILKELEKMGIMETYEIIGKVTSDSINNEKYTPRPSDFTIFYFIGIAYSSSIGGMATFVGSETNQLFMNYCAAIFPDGPKVESPRYLLLTLPGVIIMEMFLYLWLNFYFLGMLRVQNYTALQASLTSDEEQFISVLLARQYQQMGKIKFPEMVVGTAVIMAAILQAMVYSNSTSYSDDDKFNTRRYVTTSVPSIICVLILFLIPSNMACLKFCRKQNDDSEPLPTSASGGFLTWSMVKNNLDWTVIFLTASANITFDSLEDSGMTEEFEKFLSLFTACPPTAQACIVIVFCKILTEFASNATVGRCLLALIANVGVKSKVNPLYLMLSATLSTSLPFHLVTGTPAYAMIASYVHIPPRKLMVVGIGPSLLAIVLNLFTACVWSKVIWPEIDSYPAWADGMKINNIP
ncbi:protein I'm not dead yet-like isoform X3 [Maniola jurtina]|uniref:protein I'm not dead yet-like isoform X3 n=1 Tax=Maniola jurtina TaxID=191418 RepID=UPI001E688A60|nr:protein I'm not dead yet-like isoform X3 [Maniola jurtina]